jgi:hypothetical protein
MECMLPQFRIRSARLLALLALIAGLLAPAMPSFAAPAQAHAMHAAMDCNGQHRPAPMKHGGGIDCCIANVCAMNLALPDSPSELAPAFPAVVSRYDLRALLQPVGIEPVPIPHPPKTAA